MKTMRLLFLCPSYPAIGGVDTVTSLLVDFFIERGYEVYILVPSVEKTGGGSLDKHMRYMIAMKGRLNSPENLEFIDNFICDHDINGVFNQGVFSDACLHSYLHKDVLFINTLHGCPFWEEKKFANSKLRQLYKAEKTSYKKFKVIIRYILGKINPRLSFPSIDSYYRERIDSSSFYVVLDEAYKLTLQNRLYGGKDQDKIRFIPNPIRLPAEIEHPKANLVLFVGRLIAAHKRVDRLLRIWKSIQDKIPDWDLFIIGDGEDRINLEKLSESLKLDRIRFLGKRNPHPYYKIASILCLTSNYEGFPIVLPEAQSYGLVPVTFNCTEAISGIINNNVDGIIVAPYDEAAFSKELLTLINDEERRVKMQQSAFMNVQKLNINKIGEAWLKLMDENQSE